MEAACRQTAEYLRFWAPCTSHDVTVIVLGLELYSKDPDGVGDAINIFIFPDLSPSASSEAVILARRWYVILDGGALTSFADTSLLLDKQQVEPFTSWEAADKQIEAWGVLCHALLGSADVHHATYKVFNLVK